MHGGIVYLTNSSISLVCAVRSNTENDRTTVCMWFHWSYTIMEVIAQVSSVTLRVASAHMIEETTEANIASADLQEYETATKTPS